MRCLYVTNHILFWEKKDELDDLLASECPLCGDIMIKSVDKPFVDASQMKDIEAWAV